MGGSGGGQAQPQAPPTPQAGTSITEFIENQPRLFELQQEQAPQEAQLQLELLQEFGPQLGAAARDAQRAVNPETSAIQEELAGTARARMRGEGISQAERDQFLSDFSGQLGTNAGSPIGAFDTSRNLMLMNQQRQREGENLGLSLAGRQPLAQPAAPTTNNISGSLSPGDILGFNSSNFGSQANIFGSQAGMYNGDVAAATARRGQTMSMIGSIGGGLLSAGGSMGAAGIMASSRTLKHDIVESTIDSLDIIRQLEMVEYQYNEGDDKHHIGMIAEDVPEILARPDRKGLDVVNMIGILFDANQKLLKRLEVLEGVA